VRETNYDKHCIYYYYYNNNNNITKKTIVLYYTYKLWDSSITRTDAIKDRGVQLDSKLHFYALVNHI